MTDQEPPPLEHKFSWLSNIVNPALECKWCLIYENSPCETQFKEMLQDKSVKSTTEKLFQKCLASNKPLLQSRADEFKKWETDNFDTIRKWNEFLDLERIKSQMTKE